MPITPQQLLQILPSARQVAGVCLGKKGGVRTGVDNHYATTPTNPKLNEF